MISRMRDARYLPNDAVNFRSVLICTRPGALLNTDPQFHNQPRDALKRCTGYAIKPLSQTAALHYLGRLVHHVRGYRIGFADSLVHKILHSTLPSTPFMLLLSFAAAVEAELPSFQNATSKSSSDATLISPSPLPTSFSEHHVLRRTVERAVSRKVHELRLRPSISSSDTSLPDLYSEVFDLLTCYAYSLRMDNCNNPTNPMDPLTSPRVRKCWYAAAPRQIFEAEAERYFGPVVCEKMAQRLVLLKRQIRWTDSDQARYARAQTPATAVSIGRVLIAPAEL